MTKDKKEQLNGPLAGSPKFVEKKPSNQVVFQEYEMPNGTMQRRCEKVGGGEVIVRFDKTPLPKEPSDIFCPHFLEMKWATGCPYHCSWCYLQGTLRIQGKKPIVKDMTRTLKHLRSFFAVPQAPELLNSGEISDSLLWYPEPKRLAIMPIIEAFQNAPNYHQLLLVTKGDYVAPFVRHGYDNLIFSFSINATKVAKRWEQGSPTPVQRLDAARWLSDAGYRVRIRLDPIVPIEGWENAYRDIIYEMDQALEPERITIGTLRGLASTVANCKDDSWTEYVTEKTNFGKRMPKSTRISMYEFILNELAQYGYTDVALCKESLEVLEYLGIDHRSMRCNCLK